ncbi:kinase-like protein [Cylindrobasidium torrendii FP15055 ss-10]|uniref:Kinase-like protein n=1 Tax=Cylindrobasidium torrendii FP15055 ss-10 TaxID=1314674 RepID=A0A0D7B7M3_9AGAR|nr:kinase-like protein [Cylindrobasidium torrendii FP15055 ss-10]
MAWRANPTPTGLLDDADNAAQKQTSSVSYGDSDQNGLPRQNPKDLASPQTDKTAPPLGTFNKQYGHERMLDQQTEIRDHADQHVSAQDRMDNYQKSLDTWPPGDAVGRRECLLAMINYAGTEAVYPRSMRCPGVRVDDLQVHQESGLSYIYKGVYNGKAVAVKVPKHTIVRRKETKKEWVQTALLWRQLHHPNILQCYGVNEGLQLGRDLSPICLVFPWVPNGDLRHYIQDKVPFRDDDMFPLNALRDVARGLQYLHNHNPPIVHADIRSANVLVKQDTTCCISEFELSFPVESAFTSHGGDVPGSIRFMAPEVLSSPTDSVTEVPGRESYDTPARDVYSFGCMIVEIYTAQDPFFWLKNSAQIIRAVYAGHAKPWRTKPTGLADALWDLACRCWCANPAERPSIDTLYRFLCLDQRTMNFTHFCRRLLEYDESQVSQVSIDGHDFASPAVWSALVERQKWVNLLSPCHLDNWPSHIRLREYLYLVLSSAQQPSIHSSVSQDPVDLLTYMQPIFKNLGWYKASDSDVPSTIHSSVEPLFIDLPGSDHDMQGEALHSPFPDEDAIWEPAFYPPEWPPLRAHTWADAWDAAEHKHKQWGIAGDARDRTRSKHAYGGFGTWCRGIRKIIRKRLCCGDQSMGEGSVEGYDVAQT